MTTQSKSALIPFLIVAAIIFAVALGWKLLSKEESTTANNYEAEVAEFTTAAEVKTKKPTTEPEIEIVDYDKPNDFVIPVTEEEKEQLRNVASANMNFGMRFHTVEKAIEGLRKYRENGNSESAEALINFINKQFPNESIPAELLD